MRVSDEAIKQFAKLADPTITDDDCNDMIGMELMRKYTDAIVGHALHEFICRTEVAYDLGLSERQRNAIRILARD